MRDTSPPVKPGSKEDRRLRVLALTRYGCLGAASRYRLLQYIPSLASLGVEIDAHSLLDDDYVSAYYRGDAADKWSITRSYMKRLWTIASKAESVDVLWIEKEAFPFVPAWFEMLLIGRVQSYVVDFDDAVFHNYEQHRSRAVRSVLGQKYDHIMGRARVVVAGNNYIANRALEAGARRVEVLPTVVDLCRYGSVEHKDEREVRIGWIGTPYTAKYLDALRPVFRQLATANPIRFVTIGSGPLSWGDVPLEVRTWSEETEIASLQSLSIGVMPLPDNPFERGKSGLKLIQYMAVGLPVIASPVGVNREIVEPGVNGYLCETPDEWIAAIEGLAADPALRRRMGQAGRRKVEQQYSLQVAAPRLARLLRDAARRHVG